MRSKIGYVIALLGAALFVASCFLPYYGIGRVTISIYRQSVNVPTGDGVNVGGLLYIFAGVTIAASIAIVGAARSEPSTQAPAMLAAAVAAWSLPWIGFMLSAAETIQGASLEVGYWTQAISIGLVIIGTIVTFALARVEAQEPDATDA